jgi:hypothetical protein
MRRKTELGSVPLGYEVEVLASVAGDEGAHKRAERKDRETGGTHLGERVGDKSGAEPLTLEARIDQGVNERDQPAGAAVLGEAGQLTVDSDLEALAPGLIDDGDYGSGRGSHQMDSRTGTDPC